MKNKDSKNTPRGRSKTNAPIKRVVTGVISSKQRNKKIPEWQSVTFETQQKLDALSDSTCAQKFIQKNRLKLEHPSVVKSHLGLLWPHVRIADLLRPERLFCFLLCPPKLRVRKNQRNLTVEEWERFKGAISSLMSSGITVPTYQDFVDIHVQAMTTSTGMNWGAHGASNFLPWHREYLYSLESRLRLFNPAVTIPYWDWSLDQTIPVQLENQDDMARWGITRNPIITGLPTPTQVTNTLAQTTWDSFRGSLESIHNTVHVRIGGQMGGASSPQDPLFWLHHAFIDKLWADWQKLNTGTAAEPTNKAEVLQPAPLITRTVKQTMDTRAMGYVYI